MEAVYLTFEPSEFTVEEEIEVDETVQREDRVRFFTLDEQLTDAYEKMIPSDKKVTKFALQRLRRDIDLLRDLYTSYIVSGKEKYDVREKQRYGTTLPPWIRPVYAGTVEDNHVNSFSWDSLGETLLNQRRTAGGYDFMMELMPTPHIYDAGAEHPLYPTLHRPTEFSSDTGEVGFRALPPYVRTSSVIRDDGTLELVDRTYANGDKVAFRGYYLSAKPFPVPRPREADHDFLSTSEGRYVDKAQPLVDLYPELDSILDHGVPRTSDPYHAAKPYLDFFQVHLQDIPHDVWTRTFPPAPTFEGQPLLAAIDWPPIQTFTASEDLQQLYSVKNRPRVYGRKWCTRRPDGGLYIAKSLLADTLQSMGSVPLDPQFDIAVNYPDAGDCDLAAPTTINAFQEVGVVRVVQEGKMRVRKCIPVDAIRRERAIAGLRDRLPVGDDAGHSILENHRRILETHTSLRAAAPREVFEHVGASRPPSALRDKALAIYRDAFREREDKLADIQKILSACHLTSGTGEGAAHLFMDDEVRFVLCAHIVAILEGKLEANKTKYYADWTNIVDGFRVCRFCGEQVASDVLQAQEEFDEDGHVIRQAAVLSSGEEAAITPSDKKMVGLMKPLNLAPDVEKGEEEGEGEGPPKPKPAPPPAVDNATDEIIRLLFSILNLPTDSSVRSLLATIRRALPRVAAAIAQAAKVQNKTTPLAPGRKTEGALGIAIVALLIQCHEPALEPKMTIDTYPLETRGYPRDSKEVTQPNIADLLIKSIKKAFEYAARDYQGVAAETVKDCMKDGKETMAQIRAVLLNVADENFSEKLAKSQKPFPEIVLLGRLLREARLRHADLPPPMEQVVARVKDIEITITRFPPCSTTSFPIFNPSKAVRLKYEPLRLDAEVTPNIGRIEGIEAAESSRVTPTQVPQKKVAERLSIPVLKNHTSLESLPPLTALAVANYITRERVMVSRDHRQTVPDAQIESIPTTDSSSLSSVARGLLREALQARFPSASVNLQALRMQYNMLTQNVEDARARVLTARAEERQTIVRTMRENMNDDEREITGRLIALGLQRQLMTEDERERIAARLRGAGEEEDVGAGAVRDGEDQEAEVPPGFDEGAYGDRLALPGNEGKDYAQDHLLSDERGGEEEEE